MGNILKIENLSVGYGDKIILKGIDINVDEGEFVGIIGPNGTGKSTLIKAITDLIDIKEGIVKINGIDNKLISKRDRAKIIAVVPQEYNIDFKFNALDIVMMGRNPHMYGIKNTEKSDFDIVREAMLMTKTWKLKDRYFDELSGGERQRIVIARAIAQQTKVILLDEPTSHLDIHHQLEIMELISMLKKKNITIIAVLHDINMAARFSDRLILLNHGTVVADGTPDEVIDKKYLGKVYKMEMIIRENKVLSTKEIVPIRVLKEKINAKKYRIHVVCGGGSGEQILERLNSLGFEVTCGVLNKGDSDFEICRLLGVNCVTSPPFSDIGETEMLKNKMLMKSADIILVTDVPYGRGNLKNLEMLLDTDKKIYMKRTEAQYDFTGGLARNIIDELEEKDNFIYINDYEELVETICGDEWR